MWKKSKAKPNFYNKCQRLFPSQRLVFGCFFIAHSAFHSFLSSFSFHPLEVGEVATSFGPSSSKPQFLPSTTSSHGAHSCCSPSYFLFSAATLFELVQTLPTQRKIIFIVQIVIIVPVQLATSMPRASVQSPFISLGIHLSPVFVFVLHNNIPFYIAAHYHLFSTFPLGNFHLKEETTKKKPMCVFESPLY